MTKRTHHPRPRRSFTLVELVLACALLAILLAAGRGAVLLASKSARSVPADQSVALSSALDELTTDLQCATQVVRVTSNAIGVVVPDRNGDGEDETIDYSWSGTPGAPLLRTFNSATPETLVASMQSFTVSTVQQSITVPGTAGVKSTERLVGGNSTSSGLYTTTINSTTFRAASFVPSLPTTATSWSLTRVRLMVKQNAPVAGSFTVQIQSTNAQSPSGTVLATTNVAESDISASYAWKDITFTGLDNLSTFIPIAVVVSRTGTAVAPCDLQHTGSGGAMVAGNALYSSSNGTSWAYVSANDMIYAVYGIPNTPTATDTATGVSSVRITAESSPGVVMHINVPASNVPQM